MCVGGRWRVPPSSTGGTRASSGGCCCELTKRLSEGLTLFESPEDIATIVDPKGAAESAGLRYVSDERPGIHRRKSGKGFSYLSSEGTRLLDLPVLARLRSL